MALEKNTNLIPVICKITYQFTKNVVSVIPGTTTNQRKVTLADGKEWLPIYFSPGTAKYTQKPIKHPAGKFDEHRLVCKYPGESVSNKDELELLDRLPIIVRFEYSSGEVKLMGSLLLPSQFSAAFASDKDDTADLFTILQKSPFRLFNYEETS